MLFVAFSLSAVVVNVGTGYQYTEIQVALDNFNPTQDEICVYPGTYQPINIPQIQITIYSMDGPETTIIDGDNEDPCISIGCAQNYVLELVWINGFTIQNGYSETNGAGININSKPVNLVNLVIQNNSAVYHGGGIYSQNSDVNIQSCTIVNNYAGLKGGGIYENHNNYRDLVLNWNNSIYSNQTGDNGKDIYSSCGTITAHLQTFTIENSNSYGNLYTGYNQNVVITAEEYVLTSVEEETIEDCKQLINNFPNPVSNSTKIMFNNQNNIDTTITIYNSKGQKIDRLNTELGFINLDTREYNNGVYFYRVRNQFIDQIRKMIVLK